MYTDYILLVSLDAWYLQTEAPMLYRPYLKDLTPSEIYAVMVGGFSTIAGILGFLNWYFILLVCFQIVYFKLAENMSVY